MKPDSETMSRVDTAWLRMDNDVNLMMIVGVWLLEPGVRYEHLCERVAERLLKYPRFAQRVVEDVTGARWVTDEQFDIHNHVIRHRLRRKRGQSARAALQNFAGELTMTPLDRDKPLWQFHLIERYDGGSALVARIHHCIGDGIALISVLLSITDDGKDPPQRPPREKHVDDGDGDWLSDSVLKPLTEVAVRAIDATGGGVAKTLERIADPAASLGTVELAKIAYQAVSDVAALALMPDDSPTRLKGKPVGKKRVAWGEPLALDAVKAVSKALNCSINDVLLSCVAGAIGSYLREQGDNCDGQDFRAMVPVNLRPMSQAWQLGNRFGLVPLLLPIGETHPVRRLLVVRQRMLELKGSYQPLLAFAVLALAGLLIKPAQEALLGLFAKKASAVMTNVPGPTTPLKFCGSTLRQIMVWVPQSGDIGVGVSVLSYGGGVQFGLITDEALCPDPQAIIDRFEPEFDQLLWVTLMMPWGDAEEAAETAAA